MPAQKSTVSVMMPAPMPAFFKKMTARFVRVSVINASSNASFFERNIAIPVRIAIIWTISVKETAPKIMENLMIFMNFMKFYEILTPILMFFNKFFKKSAT